MIRRAFWRKICFCLTNRRKTSRLTKRLIPLTWVIFRITDLRDLGAYFSRLFPFFGTPGAVSAQDAAKQLGSYWWLLLVSILLCLPQPRRFFEKYRECVWMQAFLFLLFWVCVYFIATSSGSAFLYSRF